MHTTSSAILTVALIFALGGLAKGVAGMGLPTLAMGLLGILMAPAGAAALIVIPSLVTNVWQFASGRHHLVLVRRMWPMLIMICLVTWVGAGLITGADAGRAAMALGAVLVVYAALGLAKIHFSVPRRHELWLSPAVGATTGIVTGATGVLVIPAAPYLQALGLDKDDLVQALGLSFSTSTVALAAGLASHGAFQIAHAGESALCTVPALVGMRIGQVIRGRVDPARFRDVFLIGMMLLGADLAAHSIF
jgi:uncharacterized membrane protein YfcA